MRKFSAVVSLFFALPAFAEGAPVFKKDKLTIETAAHTKLPFTVEVADEQPQREEGLKHRSSMPENTGMLFVFDEDNYAQMWMKDTQISLDMLFLDSHGKIIHIAQKTTPESTDIISAKRDSRAVLELTGGTTEKLGIKVDDHVIYPAFK